MLARPNASAASTTERKTCRSSAQPMAAASIRRQNGAGRQFTAKLLVRNTLTRQRAQQKPDPIAQPRATYLNRRYMKAVSDHAAPLEPEIAQARVIVGTAAKRPVILAPALLDRQVVNAGNTHAHESVLIEFP